MTRLPFHSIYAHGFVRVAVGIPAVRVADPPFNVAHTIALAERASGAGAAVVVFPELGLSAYSNEDLFHQDALLDATTGAVEHVIEASRRLTPIVVVGAPLRLRVENQLGYKMIKWIERIEFIESERSVGQGEGGSNEDNEYFDLIPNI